MLFFFEDRRSLVWDASAQRQLLRFLFLPAATAQKWTEDERAILKLDSTARNLQFAIGREEEALVDQEEKEVSAGDVRQELKALQRLQEVDAEKRTELNDAILDAESRRDKARLRHVQVEQERETRYRELERAKLIAIQSVFPKQSDTAKFIIAQLLSEGTCLVCGNHVPATAAELESRIKKEHCVICDSDISGAQAHIPESKVAERRVAKAASALAAIEPELQQTKTKLAALEQEYAELARDSASLDAALSERSNKIAALVRRLPPEEAELHKQREDLASMRARLAKHRADLEELRTKFARFVRRVTKTVAARSTDVKDSFDRYAEGFLLEQCALVWSSHPAQIGQTGAAIDFPAFELEMTGTDFASPVRRTGPEQVSESQREFIDLAFRMALIEVAGENAVGTLVIDAPESSLDAVFVSRAATVLSRFAKPAAGNRLVITSNLVEGRLIPELVAMSAPPSRRLSHLVDLFDIAEPTAAIRKLNAEYRAVKRSMLRGITSRKGSTRRGRS